MLQDLTRDLVGSKAQRLGGMKWRVPGWELADGGIVRSMMEVYRTCLEVVEWAMPLLWWLEGVEVKLKLPSSSELHWALLPYTAVV